MEKYTVYILYSENSKRYYIGQANDLEARIVRHNSGYELSTKPYVPWSIVCAIQKSTRGEAVILERKFKNLNTEDLKKFIAKYGLTSGVREA